MQDIFYGPFVLLKKNISCQRALSVGIKPFSLLLGSSSTVVGILAQSHLCLSSTTAQLWPIVLLLLLKYNRDNNR